MPDVLIVGGGIAGLATAYELQRRGISSRVLERSGRPGGVIVSEHVEGFTIDAGPDALLIQKPDGIKLCQELGLGSRLVSTLPPRLAYIQRGGVLYPLPAASVLGIPTQIGPFVRTRLFSWRGKLRMGAEVFVPRTSGAGDESIGAFMRRRFGAEATTYLAEPLLAGIHAGDVERLSMRALFPRLLEAERQSGSVLRAFRALHATPSPRGAFVSLPGGTGELIDALLATMPDVVRTGARVTELRRAGSLTLESGIGRVEARAVILAVPAYVVASLLRAFDTTLAAFCDAVPYASTATVAFGYRREQIAHPMQGTGFVVPRVERSALLAGTWVTSKWPGRAPEGHVLLRGFLGGGRDPQRLEDSDEELISTARTELSDLLGITGEPIITRLFRWTRQSPQYEVGHLQRVAAIDDHLASLPGVFLTGSGFRAIGIPDCIADARATAQRAAAYVSARHAGVT